MKKWLPNITEYSNLMVSSYYFLNILSGFVSMLHKLGMVQIVRKEHENEAEIYSRTSMIHPTKSVGD